MHDKPLDYFEGTLQLRDVDEELIMWVRKTIKKDGKARIAKAKRVRGGIDLYLSSQRYLRALGLKLKKTFPGILKNSRKLHTQSRSSGKLLYRVSVLFRPINFKKGDRIMYQGEEYLIMRVSDKAHLKKEQSGKKIIVNLDRLLK